jgi:Fe-S-cluster containining protein
MLERATTKEAVKSRRSCGTCSACCTLLRIDSQSGYSTRLDNAEDIAKPAGERCRFLTDKGCGIYEVRPIVCRGFKCDWLQGRKGFAAQDAPPKVGYFGLKGSLFVINDN